MPRHLFCFALAFALSAFLSLRGHAQVADTEKKTSFEVLFDGKSFDGWGQKGNWIIEDGALVRKEKGGNLTYKKKPIPDDFELHFDWKIGKGCNSGLYYRPGQYEYQLLDNPNHANGKNPRTRAASLFFCMAPSKDATKPVGEWNTGKIACQGSIIQHWLNGERVVDFDYKDTKWAFELELLRIRGADLSKRGAYLQLQDHGDPVAFRNLKLRVIPKGEKIDHQPVTPMAIPEEILQGEKAYIEKGRKKKT